LVGVTSLQTTFAAAVPPPFITPIVYVIVAPGDVDAGPVAVALLFVVFDSVLVVVTLAVFVIVAPAVPVLTRTTRVNDAVAEAPNEAYVAVTAPVPPTAGADVIHPDGAVNDTNVVLAGTASLSDTFAAAALPPFDTTIA
jgi:hypothetical protein